MEYKWIAQDRDGTIAKYKQQPRIRLYDWLSDDPEWKIIERDARYVNYVNDVNDWKSRLINLETHDYKIEGGLLVQEEKGNKPTPRKHAELACKYFMDDSVEIEIKYEKEWVECNYPEFDLDFEYREKPKTQTVKFRNYLYCGEVRVTEDQSCLNKNWIGDWQTVEVEK